MNYQYFAQPVPAIVWHSCQISALLFCFVLWLILYKMNQQALDQAYIKPKLPPLPKTQTSMSWIQPAMRIYVSGYLAYQKMKRPIKTSAVHAGRIQTKRAFAARRTIL